jgi:hypothetical protein
MGALQRRRDCYRIGSGLCASCRAMLRGARCEDLALRLPARSGCDRAGMPPTDRAYRTPIRRSRTVRFKRHARRAYQPFQCAAPGQLGKRLADGSGGSKVTGAVLQLGSSGLVAFA